MAAESRQGITISSGLLFESALSIADGRFADGKRLAGEARLHAGPHNVVTSLIYGGQIIAGRLEQGRLTEVIDGLRELQYSPVDLPAWRAMLAGVLADAGDLVSATAELIRLKNEGLTRPPHDFSAPLAVRYLAEVCRHLGDVTFASELLPHILPWAGQMLVVPTISIEGASDRSIGHLKATLGRFDEADDAYTAAELLERANGFDALAARTEYWHACALLERNTPEDPDRAAALLARVVSVSDGLGMRRLHERAVGLLGLSDPRRAAGRDRSNR